MAFPPSPPHSTQQSNAEETTTFNNRRDSLLLPDLLRLAEAGHEAVLVLQVVDPPEKGERNIVLHYSYMGIYRIVECFNNSLTALARNPFITVDSHLGTFFQESVNRSS